MDDSSLIPKPALPIVDDLPPLMRRTARRLSSFSEDVIEEAIQRTLVYFWETGRLESPDFREGQFVIAARNNARSVLRDANRNRPVLLGSGEEDGHAAVEAPEAADPTIRAQNRAAWIALYNALREIDTRGAVARMLELWWGFSRADIARLFGVDADDERKLNAFSSEVGRAIRRARVVVRPHFGRRRQRVEPAVGWVPWHGVGRTPIELLEFDSRSIRVARVGVGDSLAECWILCLGPNLEKRDAVWTRVTARFESQNGRTWLLEFDRTAPDDVAEILIFEGPWLATAKTAGRLIG